MFPLEEGVWGEPWFPHRPWLARASGGWVVGLFGNASASKDWAECLQLPNSYACLAGLADGQHKMTYRSGEAERGGGSIYGDGPRRGDPG